jgi:protease-4
MSDEEKKNRVDKKQDIPENLNLAILQFMQEQSMQMAKFVDNQNKQGRFRFLFYLVPILLMIGISIKNHYDANKQFEENGYVSQVVLKGAIKMDSPTASADVIIPALRGAFADKDAKGVVFRISSPGGSPTQSMLIHDELKLLQEKYPEKELVVIGEESLTSGAYWIAAAAKDIHVLPATFTGSIGVIFSTFDVSKLADRFNIKRRIITGGVNKSRIDMFIEPRPEDLAKLQGLATQLHEQFIKVVTDSRKDRLIGDPEILFSGDFWVGDKAKELGLVDSVTSTSKLLNERFGTDVVKDYSRKPGFMESLKPGNPLASTESALDLLSQAWSFMVYAELPTVH